METKLHHFIHGLKLHLKEALVLRQPGDYNMAISIAKLKKLITQTKNDEILTKLGKELQSQKINSSAQVNDIGYNGPVQMSKEVEKLKAEIRQLKQEKNTGSSMLFCPNNKKLRSVDGQPVSNTCKHVGHTTKVCCLSNRSYQPRGYNNQFNWGNNFIN